MSIVSLKTFCFANISLYLLPHRQACLPMNVFIISPGTDSSLCIAQRIRGPHPEVLLQPLNPVRCVYHRLDALVVVQVSEVRLVGGILGTLADVSVVQAH